MFFVQLRDLIWQKIHESLSRTENVAFPAKTFLRNISPIKPANPFTLVLTKILILLSTLRFILYCTFNNVKRIKQYFTRSTLIYTGITGRFGVFQG